ncbi:MAG: hypothetical protein V1799_16680 [bacterium]
MFFAHSENDRGEKHNLTYHILHTIELVRSFAPLGQSRLLFYLAARLKDNGKLGG